MTDTVYHPAVFTWHVPKLMCADRPVAWLAADNLGAIAAGTFGYLGLHRPGPPPRQQCVVDRGEPRDHRHVTGRASRSFPMTVWLFERIVGTDLTAMWRWLRANEIDLDTGPARAILPEAATVESWLRARLGHDAEVAVIT